MTSSDSDRSRLAALEISGLTVHNAEGQPILRGIDLQLHPGRIQGLAGESGSGKTMTGLAAMGLLPTGLTAGGSIRLAGTALLSMTTRQLSGVRGRRISMVFQDPSTSLHPMLTVGSQLTDHMRRHLRLQRRECRDRAVAMLERVHIPDPSSALSRYPHQFSGGQRQRIAIAIALVCGPDVLIADEPTTALDVTVQAGVLHLLRSLADDLGLAVLLVTHDMGVMSAVADDVAVMRGGLIVESASRTSIFANPQHEHTRSLLASLPGATGGISSLDDVRHLLDAGVPNRAGAESGTVSAGVGDSESGAAG